MLSLPSQSPSGTFHKYLHEINMIGLFGERKKEEWEKKRRGRDYDLLTKRIYYMPWLFLLLPLQSL